MCLMCYEKYGWAAEVTMEQPLQCYIYLPVMWTALDHIAEDRRRAAGG